MYGKSRVLFIKLEPMKPKIIFILFIFHVFLVLQSCQNYPAEKAIGVYYCTNDYDATHKLTLKADGTFTFDIREGLYFEKGKGTWKTRGNCLLLKTPRIHSSHKIIECDTCKSNFLSVYDAETKEIIGGDYKAFRFWNLKDEGLAVSLTVLPVNINYLTISNELFRYRPIRFTLNSNKNQIIEVYLAKIKNDDLEKNEIRIHQDSIVFFNGLKLERISE